MPVQLVVLKFLTRIREKVDLDIKLLGRYFI
jgi:hypothetical protein